MNDAHYSLVTAFGLRPPSLVALVGGGGKTSLLFALAQALPGPVVVTSTTRIFAAQMKLAPATCYADNLAELGQHLAQHNICLVVGQVVGDKAIGVDKELPGRLLDRPDVDFVLVEADGSRMRPIKAPAAHEPVVPERTNLLVPIVGIDALGGQIESVAHRPERVRHLLAGSDLSSNRLTAEAIAHLITHPQGGLKNAPAEARIVPFINKVESSANLTAACLIARKMLHEPRVEGVVIGAAKQEPVVSEVVRRVTGVVLAAGEAQRMGRTKQLLPWGDTTILGQTIRQLQQSDVHDTLVVYGHEAAAVKEIAAAAGVPGVYNPDYAQGEMLSSLKTGVRHLPANCAAILVMLADQPMIEPEIINQLLQAYWRGEGELIAPTYEGQRGNPVLIGRDYFAELLELPPDSAPRLLLRRHQADLRLVPVSSDSVLRDLDQFEEYQHWRPDPA